MTNSKTIERLRLAAVEMKRTWQLLGLTVDCVDDFEARAIERERTALLKGAKRLEQQARYLVAKGSPDKEAHTFARGVFVGQGGN
jgi:hypothetical protein